MLDCSRALTPEGALRTANDLLGKARESDNHKMARKACGRAKNALSRIKSSEKKRLLSSLNTEDQVLCNDVAKTYHEIGDQLEKSAQAEAQAKAKAKAQAKVLSSYKDEEIWRRKVPSTDQSHSRPGHDASPSVAVDSVASPVTGSVGSPAAASIASPVTDYPEGTPTMRSPTQDPGLDTEPIHPHFFEKGMDQPLGINELPRAQGHVETVLQLVHCLHLLQPSPGDPPEPTERDWLAVTNKDVDEKERLGNLAIKMIREFDGEKQKDVKDIAEVICLVPVLEKDDLRTLFVSFFRGIEESKLLDFHLLEGLARLLRLASPGQIGADDLVKTLELTSKRLTETHEQSPDYMYQLTLTVSHILDAMADNKVKGLNRETLHTPLLTYLRGLKGNSDPHVVHQAAYASQALLYVPNDETPLQATIRRTGKVVKGVSGLVSAVKGLDLNGFLAGLKHIQEGLAGTEALEFMRNAFEGVNTLAKSGQQFWSCLEDGLDFKRKSAWYPALRAADVLLRNGQLIEFNELVYRAPCRHELAFQWGICQRLGQLAANAECDTDSRTSAIAFLGEMYQNGKEWGHHDSIKKCILDVLMKLKLLSGGTMQAARSLLEKLDANGDAEKQVLYDGCPLRGALSQRSPSESLLGRAQKKVDVEPRLRKLKEQRLQSYKDNVAWYVPPQAKDNLTASDGKRFCLTGEVKKFLDSGQKKVFLITGDSGAGKSTFNQSLENDLWGSYQKYLSPIPLYISLTRITEPKDDLITRHLERERFTESEITELKEHREFILICDGYDESRETSNLYARNELNKSGRWRARMVISCRSEYLGPNYKNRFQPVDSKLYKNLDQFREAMIAPFSDDQIRKCVKRFVSTEHPRWQAADYMKALDRTPDLKNLVTNPFLLTMLLTTTSHELDPQKSLSEVRVTRVALYDDLVDKWFKRADARLMETSIPEDRKAYQELANKGKGFTQQGINFFKDLAIKIYQDENSNSQDLDKWKDKFFGPESKMKLLREACPLKRNGDQHDFLHRSLLEYGLARAVFEPQVEQDDKQRTAKTMATVLHCDSESHGFIEKELLSTDVQSILKSPLGSKNLVNEPSVLRFLVERVPQEPVFKKKLLAIIWQSKKKKSMSMAAANAITILVRAGVQFNGAELQDIRIPGADLSHGAFRYAQLQGAHMKNVVLRSVSMYGADLSRANMKGVQFGELPFLAEGAETASCEYSPNGDTFTVGLENGDISIYSTSTWDKTRTLKGHKGWVWGVAYSPKGDWIASGGADNTVRLWDVNNTEGRSRTFSDDRGEAPSDGRFFSSVAYSPNGDRIASGNADGTVWLWDVSTEKRLHIFNGHTGSVPSVVYSPKGGQIASGSFDKTVRLWDVETGKCLDILGSHTDQVSSVAYSPSGDQIASGSDDMTVRLWDVKAGNVLNILSGHHSSVQSVVYSPNGDQIASGSKDKTVRLWDVKTGECHHTLIGHSEFVLHITYSPNGNQIASTSWDKTVRLWNVDTGSTHHPFISHGRSMLSIACSPNGDQIASGSFDETMRLWDFETGDCRHTSSSHRKSVWSVVYSPKGDGIASCGEDSSVRLWDAKDGKCCHTLTGHKDRVSSIAYSPNGGQVASGSHDRTIRLWDVKTGAPHHIMSGHGDRVSSVMYSENGDQIASSSFDKTVRLWNVKTGECDHELTGHSDCVWKVVYSPKSHHIASGSWDNTVQLWDIQSKKPRCRPLKGHSNGVSSIAYSPRGGEIASGSFDKTVRLWDVGTGKCRHILEGHSSWISCVVYSAYGGQIASGSWDETVKVWDVESGLCQMTIQNGAKVDSIAWKTTFNGNYLAVGYANGTIQLWRVSEEEKGKCRGRLQWKSPSDALILTDTTTQDVQKLSLLNEQLLKQRKDEGKPKDNKRDSRPPSYNKDSPPPSYLGTLPEICATAFELESQ